MYTDNMGALLAMQEILQTNDWRMRTHLAYGLHQSPQTYTNLGLQAARKLVRRIKRHTYGHHNTWSIAHFVDDIHFLAEVRGPNMSLFNTKECSCISSAYRACGIHAWLPFDRGPERPLYTMKHDIPYHAWMDIKNFLPFDRGPEGLFPDCSLRTTTNMQRMTKSLVTRLGS
jgi:hypothetical protein